MQSICINRVAHPIPITPPHTKVKGFSIWAFKPDQRWKFIVIELMFYAFLYEIDEVVVDGETIKWTTTYSLPRKTKSLRKVY